MAAPAKAVKASKPVRDIGVMVRIRIRTNDNMLTAKLDSLAKKAGKTRAQLCAEILASALTGQVFSLPCGSANRIALKAKAEPVNAAKPAVSVKPPVKPASSPKAKACAKCAPCTFKGKVKAKGDVMAATKAKRG